MPTYDERISKLDERKRGQIEQMVASAERQAARAADAETIKAKFEAQRAERKAKADDPVELQRRIDILTAHRAKVLSGK